MFKSISRIVANLLLSLIIGTVFVLIVAGFIQSSNQPRTQKWDANEWTFVGEFDMDGFNVTPMKEIVTDEYRYVEVRVNQYETRVPAYFLLEVFFCEDEELPCTRIRLPATRGENVIVKCPIKRGERFQILTQVFAENGEYDGDLYCKLNYSYRLTNE